MTPPLFGAPPATDVYMYLDGTVFYYTTSDGGGANTLYNGGTIGDPYSNNNVYNYLYYTKSFTAGPTGITKVVIDDDL